MPILNYTTTISPEKTIGEIQSMLSKRGARKIVLDYDATGQPVSLTFALPWKGTLVAFVLPCNYEGVLSTMKRDKVAKAKATKDQAIRTGWRIIREWVASQLAMVDAELVTLPQIFFSQAVTAGGKTLYEQIGDNPSQLLLKA